MESPGRRLPPGWNGTCRSTGGTGPVSYTHRNTSREGREFEAEFIRLKAGPTEASIARGDASSRARKADIKQHVRKEGKRVVIQDIPMVDPVSYTHLDVYKRQAFRNVNGPVGFVAVATPA